MSFPHRLLRSGLVCSLPADSDSSLGWSQSLASEFVAPIAASPFHPRLGTAEALSVQEPAQRLSCSRRLVLAVSPMTLSAEDSVFKNKTRTGRERHTLHVYTFTSWFSFCFGCVKYRRLCSCPCTSGARAAVT